MLDRRPTVILADDHPMLVEGLRHLLAPTLEVIATVTDGQALLEVAAQHQPDLVVADVSMPGVDGIEATRRLSALSPATRVVILSFHTEPSWVHTAFAAGAWGYLAKTATPAEIDGAIREVLGGRFYVSPSVTRGFIAAIREAAEPAVPTLPEGAEALTPREQEVVRLVGQGHSNKEIASFLGVSVTTVRTHLSSVYDKLGRGNRVKLALYAAQAAGATS